MYQANFRVNFLWKIEEDTSHNFWHVRGTFKTLVALCFALFLSACLVHWFNLTSIWFTANVMFKNQDTKLSFNWFFFFKSTLLFGQIPFHFSWQLKNEKEKNETNTEKNITDTVEHFCYVANPCVSLYANKLFPMTSKMKWDWMCLPLRMTLHTTCLNYTVCKETHGNYKWSVKCHHNQQKRYIHMLKVMNFEEAWKIG